MEGGLLKEFEEFAKELIKDSINTIERNVQIKQNRSKQTVPFDILFNEFKDCGYLLLCISNDRNRIGYYICYKHFNKGMQYTLIKNFRHRKKACEYCGNEKQGNRLSIFEVNSIIESKNLKWVDGKYKNQSSILTYQCNIHKNKFKKAFYLIKKSENNCSLCADEYEQSRIYQKLYNVIKKAFYKKGLILIEDEYVNNDTPMKCYCLIHSDVIQYKTYISIKSDNGCDICSKEKASKRHRKYNFELAFIEFDKRGFVLLEKEYVNYRTPMECKCKKHMDEESLFISLDNMVRDRHGCKHCWNEKRRGSTSPNWRGGITPLISYLREQLNEWKLDSMKGSKFKCIITGQRFDDIHHLYSMHNIVQESLDELGMKMKDNIGDFTDEEIKNIISKCLEIHYRYPLGVCLTRDIHELFHREYGYINNTPEQFEEFKQRYYKGEFNHLLEKEVVSL